MTKDTDDILNEDERSTSRLRVVLDNFGSATTIKQLEAVNLAMYDGLAVLGTILVAFFVLISIPSTGSGVLDILVGAVVFVTICAFGGLWIFFMTPDAENAIEHVGTRWRNWRQDDVYTPDGKVDGTGDIKSIVGIEEFEDNYNPITRRTDKGYAALAEVTGNQMELADDNAWARSANQFGSFINGLDCSLEIHSPGRTIDPHAMVGDMESRLTQEDAKQNRLLRGAVLDHRDVLPDVLEQRGTNIREYYVGTDRTRYDIRMQDHDVLGMVDQVPIIGPPITWFCMSVVRRVPILGSSIARFGLLEQPKSLDRVKLEQRQDVSRNLSSIITDLADVKGISATRTSADEMMDLTQEFYTGDRVPPSDETRLNQIPIITIDDVDLTEIEIEDSDSDMEALDARTVTNEELEEIDGLDISDPEAAIEQLEQDDFGDTVA